MFTWGDTAYESYINTLEVIERCAEYLEENLGKKGPVFGGAKIKAAPGADRLQKAAALAPVLRGFCSSEVNMIGHFTDDERVLEFIDSNDLEKLASMGTSCPDHFLRTKIRPMVLSLSPDEDLSNVDAIKGKLSSAFAGYRKMYADYYEKCKHPDSPAIRDANPVVILYPGCWHVYFCKK